MPLQQFQPFPISLEENSLQHNCSQSVGMNISMCSFTLILFMPTCESQIDGGDSNK